MAVPVPATAYRTQFTFTVNDKNLACFFGKLRFDTVSPVLPSGVNMTAILVTKIESTRCNFVRVIVGSANPTDSTNAAQVEATRSVLDDLNIRYKEKQVIQLLNIETSPTPGALFSFYNSFFCITGVKAIYIGEPTTNEIISVYFDVPSRYLETANQLILNPQDNCIDRNRLDLECPSCNVKKSLDVKTSYNTRTSRDNKGSKPQEKKTKQSCGCRNY